MALETFSQRGAGQFLDRVREARANGLEFAVTLELLLGRSKVSNQECGRQKAKVSRLHMVPQSVSEFMTYLTVCG